MRDSLLHRRIALVTPDYPPIPGGVSISIARLAKNLSTLGHNVAVLVPHLSKIPLHRPREVVHNVDGYTVVHILVSDPKSEAGFPWSLSRLGRMPQTFLALRQWANSWRPDVLHSFTLFPFSLLTGLIAHELSIPFVVGIRGNDLDSNIFRPDVVGNIALSCRNAVRVFPVTSDLAHHLLFLCPDIDRDKICVVPNGIDQDDNPLHSDPIPSHDGKVIYGTLCEFRPKKDIDILLSAFRELHRENANTELVVAGSFAEDDATLAKIVGDGTYDAVRFVGRIRHSEAFSLLSALDVFVLPSAFDGCPNTMLEAMASGCALIGSATGGCKDLVQHGENGLLFPPLDEAGLLSCMRELLSSDFRKTLSDNALKTLRSGTTEALEYASEYAAVIADWMS